MRLCKPGWGIIEKIKVLTSGPAFSIIQYTNIDKKDKTQKKLSERLRGIGVAPQGFDYKKELLNRFE